MERHRPLAAAVRPAAGAHRRVGRGGAEAVHPPARLPLPALAAPEPRGGSGSGDHRAGRAGDAPRPPPAGRPAGIRPGRDPAVGLLAGRAGGGPGLGLPADRAGRGQPARNVRLGLLRRRRGEDPAAGCPAGRQGGGVRLGLRRAQAGDPAPAGPAGRPERCRARRPLAGRGAASFPPGDRLPRGLRPRAGRRPLQRQRHLAAQSRRAALLPRRASGGAAGAAAAPAGRRVGRGPPGWAAGVRHLQHRRRGERGDLRALRRVRRGRRGVPPVVHGAVRQPAGGQRHHLRGALPARGGGSQGHPEAKGLSG